MNATADTSLEPISLDRFFWLEAFVARLQELGAPSSPEQLTELGRLLFDKNRVWDPRVAADAVWALWPADSGLVQSD